MAPCRYERRYVSHANEYVLALLAYNSYDNVSILCKLKPKHPEHLDIISVAHLLQGLLTGLFSSGTGDCWETFYYAEQNLRRDPGLKSIKIQSLCLYKGI